MLGSESQKRLELCQTIDIALGHALYRSILEVRCKSSQIEAVCVMEGKATESDTLHAAIDKKLYSGHGYNSLWTRVVVACAVGVMRMS